MHPVRGNGGSVQRFASQAGSITGGQALIRMGKELDILRFWLARRAAGAAKDPGGFDRGKKHSLVRGVAFEHGADHLGVGREQSVL
ncbi:hypothetical protein D3C84_404040 [compost metagenome]